MQNDLMFLHYPFHNNSVRIQINLLWFTHQLRRIFRCNLVNRKNFMPNGFLPSIWSEHRNILQGIRKLLQTLNNKRVLSDINFEYIFSIPKQVGISKRHNLYSIYRTVHRGIDRSYAWVGGSQKKFLTITKNNPNVLYTIIPFPPWQ